MIVYHDIISNDELVSDSFKLQEEDDVIYRVECKLIRKGAVKVDTGSNPATGDGESGAAEPEDSSNDGGYDVIDVVDCCRLESTGYDKKGYMLHIKDYMKSVKKHLQEKNPERVAIFEKNAATYVKKVLGNFKAYDFYTGESMNPEAMVMLYEAAEDGREYMIFWKDGLNAVKY